MILLKIIFENMKWFYNHYYTHGGNASQQKSLSSSKEIATSFHIDLETDYFHKLGKLKEEIFIYPRNTLYPHFFLICIGVILFGYKH